LGRYKLSRDGSTSTDFFIIGAAAKTKKRMKKSFIRQYSLLLTSLGFPKVQTMSSTYSG